MISLPPCLLLLDVSAVITSNLADWQQFARIGRCLLPTVVLDDIKDLGDHAPEAETSQKAREFLRFYPNSGWKTTQSAATHPALQPAEGQDLSKRSRLALVVAQTAYGLARSYPDALVVLVSNDQRLIQQLKTLDVNNLVGIPASAMLQWSRTKRRPVVVSHQLQAMSPGTGALAGSTPSRAGTGGSASALASDTASRRPSANRPSAVASCRSSVQRAFSPSRLSSLFFNLLTLSAIAIVALVIWKILAPQSFDRLWKQMPVIQQPAQPRKK
jgi:hypothetical protein